MEVIGQSENLTGSTVSYNDIMAFGDSTPMYTWRKGGINLDDNHFYLIVGGAFDPIDKTPNGNVLIEVDPNTKITTFYNETKLLNGFTFDNNTLNGSCIKDGTITFEKLDPSMGLGEKADRLSTPRSIDGLMFDGTANISHYCKTETPSATRIKVALCENFVKEVGSIALVHFVNTNTNATPQLNINDTGASPIFANGVAFADLEANHTYLVVFDGTNYNVIGRQKAKQVVQHIDSSDVIYPIVFSSNSELKDGVETVLNATNNLSVNPSTKSLYLKKVITDLGAKTWTDLLGESVVANTAKSGESTSFLKYDTDGGVYALVARPNGMFVAYSATENLGNEYPDFSINLLDENGNVVLDGNVIATAFEGNLKGVADKAVQDSNGNTIVDTYATKTEVSVIETNCVKTLSDYKKEVANVYATKTDVASADTTLQTNIDTLEQYVKNNYLNLVGGKLTGKLEGTVATFTKVTATTFEGSLNGNATSANKATNDGNDNNIVDTYATKVEVGEVVASVDNLRTDLVSDYVTKTELVGEVTKLESRIDNIITTGGGVSYDDLSNTESTLRAEIAEVQTNVTNNYVSNSVFTAHQSNVITQFETITAEVEELDGVVTEVFESLDNYYTKTEVDDKLDNIELSEYYTKTEIDNSHYTKTEIDNTHYTKTEIDDKLANADFEAYLKKDEASTTYATKTEVEELSNSIVDGFNEFNGTVAEKYVSKEDYNTLKAEVESLKTQLSELRTYCDTTFMTKEEYQNQIDTAITSLDSTTTEATA